MKEGNHQSDRSRDRRTVIIRLRFFFASFFCPIKTRRGLEDNNYQEGDVCNYSIARQAGSEVSKGCAVVPTSKLSLLPLSLQLSLIGEGWKKKRRKIKVFGVWRALLNWWCAKTTLPACLWTLLLFPPKSYTQSSTTESSSKRINRISPSAAVWIGHTNKNLIYTTHGQIWKSTSSE